MAKLEKLALILIGLIAGIVLIFLGKPQVGDNASKITLIIEGKEYALLKAETSLEKMRGLSGITELKNADGMIFYFKPAQKVSFWNKNTHFDLELIWMKDSRVVGRDFLPSEERTGLVIKNSPVEVDWVVELIKS
ncbi:MAG: DUF192 domain-containing protein [Patescibacteria group bacterium]